MFIIFENYKFYYKTLTQILRILKIQAFQQSLSMPEKLKINSEAQQYLFTKPLPFALKVHKTVPIAFRVQAMAIFIPGLQIRRSVHWNKTLPPWKMDSVG